MRNDTLTLLCIFLVAATAVEAFSVQIVHTTDDGDEKHFTIDKLSSNTKIKELRTMVATKVNAPNSDIVLIFNNMELQDARTLGYYKIKDGSTINAETL
ncbi:Polyubiquitin 8 [Pseudolycoriella hygida]|uniref:Polyubiquitin 8 n=1 Tax=Pseudolycoriella hygida TaxID=35572 RepID=A0A9Q0NED4_9DIPT|nr:Polyubiquitin 8 [Pseudolycoriella hygida]KAJ6648583.1 Polyubiquitin 8 [Pseudolycoriella hygida]KAJ6648584.1 Polyubiquitin 8 [Pseudolycoriella hygida]